MFVFLFMRFSYCDKILLEVLRHINYWVISISSELTHVTIILGILGCEFCVAFEHVTAWFTVEY